MNHKGTDGVSSIEMNHHGRTVTAGFTLVELMLVVAIIAIIAALAVSQMSQVSLSAKITAAESDLKTLSGAFTDPATGYLRDMRGIPGFSPALLRMANLLISTNLYGSVEDRGWMGGFRVDDGMRHDGCAPAGTFIRWDPESERGWHGPYVRHATGSFPSAGGTRFCDDDTFQARGFFPDLRGLRLPQDFLDRFHGCSIYGFPGEPAVIDPWGNPYVLQIPPPQAFPDRLGANTNLPDEVRFRYARVVSAGPDGRLDTPCFASNTATNWWATSWDERTRRLSRQAGLIDGNDRSARGDDIVLFLVRNDTDEGEERE